MLPCTQDQVGRRQLDWHCTRHTPTSGGRRAPLRLLDLVGQAGIAVEVGVVGQLLGDLLHLVDGDWHPGGGRLLPVLLSPLVVVSAVRQLGVGSTNVRHCSGGEELGWVELFGEVVRVGFGASVKWSRTLAPKAGLEGSY